jgi:hypothetical protein
MKDLLYFSQVDKEHVRDFRQWLSNQLIEPMEQSESDVYQILVEEQRERQRAYGFDLVLRKGEDGKDTAKHMFNVYAKILLPSGDTLRVNGKTKYVSVLTDYEKKTFRGNSRYFFLEGGNIFMKNVEQKVKSAVVRILKDNPEMKKSFPSISTASAGTLSSEFSRLFLDTGSGVIKRSIVSDSWNASDIHTSLSSKGMGSISKMIGIIAELSGTSIYIFDSDMTKIIVTGISNSDNVVLLRMNSFNVPEPVGTILSSDTLNIVSLIFSEKKDRLVTYIKEMVGKVDSMSGYFGEF